MNLPIIPGAPQAGESNCSSAPSRCEECGESFRCGAAEGRCWCSELHLTEAARAYLSQRYRSCLCRACLEKYAGASMPETPGESTQGGIELGTSR